MTILAVWGAVLSTILAAIKAWELWRDRPRLTGSRLLLGHGDLDEQIIIENPTAQPILVTCWDLVWARPPSGNVWGPKAPVRLEDRYRGLMIGAHTAHSLRLSEVNHIDPLGLLEDDRASRHLRIRVAGRRTPIWLPV